MMSFTSEQVVELLEAADVAASLSRLSRAITMAALEDEPNPVDVEFVEAMELLARWEGLMSRFFKSGTPDQAVWDDLFLLAGGLLGWKRRMEERHN
jgi:hypothetical protein